jgi:hypothetical protein
VAETTTKQKNKSTILEVKYEQFFEAPSHAVGADILFIKHCGNIIFEPYNTRTGEFHRCPENSCTWKPFYAIKNLARHDLEAAVTFIFNERQRDEGNTKELYSAAGKAYQRARTRDFLNGVIDCFKERVTVPSIPWNATPEALPTLSGILDFSGESISVRKPYPGEYFRNPLPFTAEEILSADETTHFDGFMADLFPNPDTRKTALQCLSLAVANKGSKTIQIWTNEQGNNGKNSLLNLLSGVLP